MFSLSSTTRVMLTATIVVLALGPIAVGSKPPLIVVRADSSTTDPKEPSEPTHDGRRPGKVFRPENRLPGKPRVGGNRRGPSEEPFSEKQLEPRSVPFNKGESVDNSAYPVSHAYSTNATGSKSRIWMGLGITSIGVLALTGAVMLIFNKLTKPYSA